MSSIEERVKKIVAEQLGVKEDEIIKIVELLDRVITNRHDENVIDDVRAEVNEMMKKYPLFSNQ